MDVSSTRQQNASQDRELQKLRTNHRETKKNLVENQDQELTRLQSSHRKKRDHIIEKNNAAINHIKKDADSRVARMQEEKSTYTKNLKKNNQSSMQNLRDRLEERKSDLARSNEKLSKNIKIQRDYNSEKLSHLKDSGKKEIESAKAFQDNRVKKAHENARTETKQIYDRAKEVKQDVVKRNETELGKLNSKQHRTTSEINSRNARKLNEIKNRFHSRIEEQKKTGQKQIGRYQQDNRLQRNSLEQRNAESINKLKSDHSQKMERFSTQASTEQKNAIDSKNKQLQGVRNENHREMSQVVNNGHRVLKGEHQKNMENLRKEKGWFNNEKHQLKARNEDRIANITNDNHQKFQKLSTGYDKEYLNMEQEYKAKINNSISMNKEKLAHQDKLYMNALAKMTGHYSEKLSDAQRAESDSFYRMKELNTTFSETKNSYVVTAEIPEHERENIKVIADEERITIEGARKFSEKVDTEEGSKKTASHQTYSETFPIKHKVVPKNTVKEYKDGVLKIILPKVV